mmetsp:Transcript_47072/g.86288  ORF Transcript_47072/g.86288 Transcript_47072/m.86288 type:complete len:486 (-) Transcript_47072:34-1491(-)
MESYVWQHWLRHATDTVSGCLRLSSAGGASAWQPRGLLVPSEAACVPNPSSKEEQLARYAEFLGAIPESKAVQSMAVMHAGQLMYATANEASVAMLPFINSAVGADVLFYARLQAITAGVQLLGGLGFGKVADIVGPRIALVVSHASVAVQCAIVAASTSKAGLLLSALPALTMHGYQSAQQAATLNSPVEKREVALGLTGVSYGIGVLGGSLVVSYMAGLLSPREVMLATAVAEAIVAGFIAWAYPVDTFPNPDDMGVEGGGKAAGEGLLAILSKPHVLALVLLKLAVTTSGGMVWVMAQQFALDPFGFSTVETGLLLSYIGGVQLFSQGVLMPFIGTPSLRTLYWGSTVATLVPLLGMACTSTSGSAFVCWLGPLTAAIFCANVAISSALTCSASAQSSGTLAALSMAPMTVAFMLSPVAAAATYKAYGFRMVPLVASAALIGSVALVIALDDAISGPEVPQEAEELQDGEHHATDAEAVAST